MEMILQEFSSIVSLSRDSLSLYTLVVWRLIVLWLLWCSQVALVYNFVELTSCIESLVYFTELTC